MATPEIMLQRLACGHEGMISGLAFSPTSPYLASSSLDSTVRIWSLDGKSAPRVVSGHSLNVTALAWSPNGQSLATASDDRTIGQWQFPSLKDLGHFEKHPRGVSRIAWAPSGSELLSCSNDRRIRVLDVASKTIKDHIEGHVSLPRSIAFSRHGEYLASGSDEGTVRLWKGDRYTPDKVLYGHRSGINDLVWHPNGQLISCSDDSKIRIWNTAGNCLREITAHDGPVKGIAVSGNGAIMVSKSWDQTLRIWRCDNWTQVAMIEEETAAPFPNVALHPKEGWLASVGAVDRVIRIWSLDLAKLAQASPSNELTSFREQELTFLLVEGLGDLASLPKGPRRPAAPEKVAPTPQPLPTATLIPVTTPSPKPVRKEKTNDITCGECGEGLTTAQIQRRLGLGFDFINCPVCEKRIDLGKGGPSNLTDWAGSRKLILAVMFTDIVDSTALATQLGNLAMRELRHQHFERVRAAISAHRGFEIKTIGDSFMAAFKTVGGGLDCALDVLHNTGHPDVRIRASLHVGPVEVEDNDLFGNMVNFCSRLLGQVKGPELCVSEEARSHVFQEGEERHITLPWNAHDNLSFKGFPGTWRVWVIH